MNACYLAYIHLYVITYNGMLRKIFSALTSIRNLKQAYTDMREVNILDETSFGSQNGEKSLKL